MKIIQTIFLISCFFHIIFIFLIHLKYYYKCLDLIKKHKGTNSLLDFSEFLFTFIFYRYHYVVKKIEDYEKKGKTYELGSYIRNSFNDDIYGFMFSKIKYPTINYLLYFLFLSPAPIILNFFVIVGLSIVIFSN